MHTGLLSALPYGIAVPLMMWIARRSDASGNRRRYIALCALCAAAGFTLSALHGNNLLIVMFALTLATVGVLSAFPLLWTLPAGYLNGPSTAPGIALVKSFGATAGFLSPYLIGAVRDATQSTAGGVFAVAAFIALGGALLGACPRPQDAVLRPQQT